MLAFVERTLTAEQVAGKRILEVGSYDVNGSVRPFIESLQPARYWGVDASPGPRVDQVVDCMKLVAEVGDGWDLVVSTEMLEHVRDWRTCMYQLAAAMASDGLLLLTTRSPGFKYHPYPEDHWRYTLGTMDQILAALDLVGMGFDDPQAPGVFVVARKRSDWEPHPDLLEGIEAEPVCVRR